MRKLFILLLLFSSYFSSFSQVKVNGYYRKNGTYVQPHYRSYPDGNPYNNYSFPGNTNPYTGKTSTGNPDTYLNNYYNRHIYYNKQFISNIQTESEVKPVILNQFSRDKNSQLENLIKLYEKNKNTPH